MEGTKFKKDQIIYNGSPQNIKAYTVTENCRSSEHLIYI